MSIAGLLLRPTRFSNNYFRHLVYQFLQSCEQTFSCRKIRFHFSMRPPKAAARSLIYNIVLCYAIDFI